MKKTMNNMMKVASAFLLLLATTITAVNADYYESITVSPVFSENQRQGNNSFYDMKMQVNQKQTVYFDVVNNGKENMDIMVEVYNGTTGVNANPQYMNKIDKDASMKYGMEDLVSVPQERVTIKPGKDVRLAVNVTMPSEELDGVVLGGIRVYPATLIQDGTGDQIQITNRLNYLIAMQLYNNEYPLEENLNLKSFGAKPINLEPAIVANVQNDKPLIMNNVNISGNVYKAGTKKVVATVDVSGGAILPNSNFDVAYTLADNMNLKPGTYDMELKIEDDNDSWEWFEQFEISKQDIKDVNDGSLIDKKSNFMFYILGLLISIILILFFILFFRRRNEDEEEEEEVVEIIE